MKAIGQFHVSAVLCPWLGTHPYGTHWVESWVASRSVWSLGEEKHIGPAKNRTVFPRSSSPSLVTLPLIIWTNFLCESMILTVIHFRCVRCLYVRCMQTAYRCHGWLLNIFWRINFTVYRSKHVTVLSQTAHLEIPAHVFPIYIQFHQSRCTVLICVSM